MPCREASPALVAEGQRSAPPPAHAIALQGVGLVVWDVGPIGSTTLSAWEQMAPLFHGAPVLALFGFPRPDDIRCLMAAGVAAVMSKPLSTGELCRRMVELATSGQDNERLPS